MASISSANQFESSVDNSGDKKFDFARKKYGSEGRAIPVYANFFPIDVKCKVIFHYVLNIEIQDDIRNKEDKNRPQRNKLIQQKKTIKQCNFQLFDRLLVQEAQLFSSHPVFDGKNNIYSKTKLNMPDKKFTCQVRLQTPEMRRPKTFVIEIHTPRDYCLDLSILKSNNVQNVDQEMQALNVIMQYGIKRNELCIGSKFFMRKANTLNIPTNSRFGLDSLKEVSFGHYQAAKMTEEGTRLNVDRVAIVFNKGGKLTDLIEQFCTEIRTGRPRRNGPPPRAVEINDNFKLQPLEKRILEKNLKGLDFEVRHMVNTYRPRFKIHCITEKSVSQIFFDQKLRDGQSRKTSVKEYYYQTYPDYFERVGQGLNPNLPCIQVGKMNPTFYPLEVVNIVEDQYDMKKLDPKLQGVMTRECGQQEPAQRFRETEKRVKNLIETRNDQNDHLNNFGIHLENKYVKCNGRILNSAALTYSKNGNNSVEETAMIQPNQGAWKMFQGQVSLSYIKPSKNVGSDWMVINFTKDFNNRLDSAPDRRLVDSFVRTVINCSRTTGNDFRPPCEIIYDEKYKGRQDLEDAMHDYLLKHKNVRLLVYMIPKNDEIYHSIKYVSEVKIGTVTQCVSHNKKNQLSDQAYVSNLMLKINSKLGGTNVVLDKSSRVGFIRKKTMIMGIDCTHPAREDRLGNSIASVVASYDRDMVNYHSINVVQPKTRNEIVALNPITKEMLENFQKINNDLPAFLLVYRDGVSDGQFNEAVNKEVNMIKKACSEISPTYNPKITYIVVQKRHHSRFLPAKDCDGTRKLKNVLPGTVIDNTITSNYFYEFYLTSHFGALGTSRPTRYIVLVDESGFSGDDIQNTTNTLSYLFPRCLKAVSVPPPVLYAHLACKRARSYVLTLDDNRGHTFGENELTPSEVDDLNKRIRVKENLKGVLYFI